MARASPSADGLTVSEVAKLTGLSVRALHHYDEIGLVRPAARSEARYRLYGQADLERLQQVLFFRELGLPLEEIGRILADPEFDVRSALLLQRRLLRERAARLEKVARAVDAAIEALEKGTAMTKEEMFEVFGEDPTRYEEEARQRWGESEAWKESQRRTRRYTKKDWQQIKAEGDAIHLKLSDLMGAGKAPTDAEVMDLAEQHRQYIARWFYPCSREFHRALGQMYVADARFTETYEKFRPGFALFLRDAFAANAER